MDDNAHMTYDGDMRDATRRLRSELNDLITKATIARDDLDHQIITRSEARRLVSIAADIVTLAGELSVLSRWHDVFFPHRQ